MHLWLISLIVASCISPIVSRGEADPSAINSEKRLAVLNQCIEQLRQFTPDQETRRIQPVIHEHSETKGCGYRVIKNGMIDLEERGWVYIILLSGHDAPKVGDIILAIDHRGRLFENGAHVCGGIGHFESSEKSAASDPDDFFSRFTSDIENSSWLPIRP